MCGDANDVDSVATAVGDDDNDDEASNRGIKNTLYLYYR